MAALNMIYHILRRRAPLLKGVMEEMNKLEPWEKSKEEWKRIYREKIEVMEEEFYPEVTPLEFYRDLFPEGSLQKKGVFSDGKGNIIAAQLRDSEAKRLLHERTQTWVITEDDFDLIKSRIVGDYFGLIAPLTFYGRSHGKDCAHGLYALALDIDYVGTWHLRNLLKQFGNGVQLRPTYLINSGKGVHVYYFLKEPQPLYRNIEKSLSDLKRGFIHRLWNDTSSLKPEDPDIAGITQGFRAVGSQSKLGKDYPVRAYRISENRYTLEEMQNFLTQWGIDVDISCVNSKPWKKSATLSTTKKKKPKKLEKKLTLEEAKKLYPEWYQERIVERKPKKKPKDYKRGTWVCHEGLYKWWQKKMREAKVGGRYFAVMALCSFGLKCGIPESKIREDAYSYREYLDSLTRDESNHFTAGDIEDALRALSSKNKYISTKASRQWLETYTKIPIPANKRNGRKQKQHLALARGIRALKKDMGEDVSGGGRPSACTTVVVWRLEHPDGRKADCIRETGLDKKTVYKWWNEVLLNLEGMYGENFFVKEEEKRFLQENF